MKTAESLKKFIIANIDGFSEKNIAIGAVDISRYNSNLSLCVIVPERTELSKSYIQGSFEVSTTYTISFLFRNKTHSELVEQMENVAEVFLQKVQTNLTLNAEVTNASFDGVEYYYDCGTVEKQATGLDIKMTILETRK